jgi:uncharacterized protein (TIGR03067 family)
LLCAAVPLVLIAYATAEDAARSDQQKLQGTWKVLAGNEGGKTLPPSRVKGTKMVVKANEIKVEEQDKQRVMTFTLDPAKEPRAIDLTIHEGKPKGEPCQGIYALEGDMLKICFALPGKIRPGNFTPVPGSGEMLFVLKRAAP